MYRPVEWGVTMFMSAVVAAKVLGFRRDGIEALAAIEAGPLKLSWRDSEGGPEVLARDVWKLARFLGPAPRWVGASGGAFADPVDIGGVRLIDRSRPTSQGRREPRASELRRIIDNR